MFILAIRQSNKTNSKDLLFPVESNSLVSIFTVYFHSPQNSFCLSIENAFANNGKTAYMDMGHEINVLSHSQHAQIYKKILKLCGCTH